MRRRTGVLKVLERDGLLVRKVQLDHVGLDVSVLVDHDGALLLLKD